MTRGIHEFPRRGNRCASAHILAAKAPFREKAAANILSLPAFWVTLPWQPSKIVTFSRRLQLYLIRVVEAGR
jgi:hypothetical protein